MKSSLLTLTVVSSLVLSGCFKNSHEGCSSCSEVAESDVMRCSTTTCAADMLPESESGLMDENMPVADEFEEIVVEEK